MQTGYHHFVCLTRKGKDIILASTTCSELWPMSPALAGSFFTAESLGKPYKTAQRTGLKIFSIALEEKLRSLTLLND